MSLAIERAPERTEARLALVRMSGVRKIYRCGSLAVDALRGIDLEIGRGEFLAIVGASGSGKSTLMNLLGCLDTPTDGRYELAGVDVSTLDRNRLADVRNRRIGFVFQSFHLLPHLTAYQNVEMPLLLGGVPARDRRSRVEALLARVGLSDRMQHRPSELSGGQMQRVAIARALAMDPDLLLADEPTGNLDSASSRDVFDLFEELWRQGRTIAVITHDPILAGRTRRLVRLQDGAIVEDRA